MKPNAARDLFLTDLSAVLLTVAILWFDAVPLTWTLVLAIIGAVTIANWFLYWLLY